MKKKQRFPLIAEDYPAEYDSYQFISLIQYSEEKYLGIIDNATDSRIRCYVLDMCEANQIDQKLFIALAEDWFLHRYRDHPLSVDLSKRGLAGSTSGILKTFNTDFVSRVIGPIPRYLMAGDGTIKKRRKRQIIMDEAGASSITFIDL